MDVRVRIGAELSIDHYLVVCKLRLARWRLPQRRFHRQSATKICWEELTDTETKLKFAEDLGVKFSQIQPDLSDVEAE